MKTIVRLLAVFAASALLAAPAQAGLTAGWNFNDAVNQTPTNITTDAERTAMLAVDHGSGTMTTDFVGTNVVDFGGTTNNAVTGDPSGQAIAFQGGASNVNNGKHVVFQVSTLGLMNLVYSMAVQRTGTGFNNINFAYSTNGSTYTSFTDLNSLPASFATSTVDFSSVAALNNQANVYLRLTFTGATSAAGNNRIDNIQFNATTIPAAAVPEPATVASTAFGLMLVGALRLRRRNAVV